MGTASQFKLGSRRLYSKALMDIAAHRPGHGDEIPVAIDDAPDGLDRRTRRQHFQSLVIHPRTAADIGFAGQGVKPEFGLHGLLEVEPGAKKRNARIRVRQQIGERPAGRGDRAGGAPAYITFDIDCLDPAFAPGTGTPVAGGPSSAKMLGVLRLLRRLDLVGADVVEVAPAYDHADITAIAGATVAMHYLGLVAARRRDG